MLFLALSHGQWKDLKDRANSRINPEDCLHWRELLGHFISLTFDLIEEILEVASREEDFLCFADSITLFKNLSEKRFPT